MSYYVYELVIVPGDIVCYVGKGKGKRMYMHRKNLNARCYSRYGLYRRLRELLAQGKDFYPRKVYESVHEGECLEEECRRIQMYGFETLFNSTMVPGRREEDIDLALRQAMSKAGKERCAKLRAIYGVGRAPDVTAKITAAIIVTGKPKDQGERISRAKKGKPLTAAHKLALRKPHKIDPETEKKRAEEVSAKMKALWASGKMKGNSGRPWSPERRAAAAKKMEILS